MFRVTCPKAFLIIFGFLALRFFNRTIFVSKNGTDFFRKKFCAQKAFSNFDSFALRGFSTRFYPLLLFYRARVGVYKT